MCPFVLYAVAAALRLAGTPRAERNRAAWAMPAAQRSAGSTQGAIRQVNGGSTPRLRLSERGKGAGLGSGLRGRAGGLAPAKREPRLKLGHGGPLGASVRCRVRDRWLAPGFRALQRHDGGALGGAAKVKFAARRGGGTLGGAMAVNSTWPAPA